MWGLGQETAEKQAPSALDFVGIFNQAIQATMKENPRVSQLIALNTCIADYNKDVKIKRWRVDTLKRKIIGNMLKVPEESIRILAEHYDLHRHSSSGPVPAKNCHSTVCVVLRTHTRVIIVWQPASWLPHVWLQWSVVCLFLLLPATQAQLVSLLHAIQWLYYSTLFIKTTFKLMICILNRFTYSTYFT